MKKLMVICLLVITITCTSFMTVFAVHDTTPDAVVNPVTEEQYIQNTDEESIRLDAPPIVVLVHDTDPD
ncbi:MAG TPA: hypothetical protein VEB00_16100 [Clostridia bacterium]|nr:hypothetical protein [Clostridia bacterium]